MEHILDLKKQEHLLIPIFEKMRDKNTILFLGAGASVGEKKYLSKEIISYYESYLGKRLNEPNITKFLDVLTLQTYFSRNHFDSEVVKKLEKLTVTNAHKILATIPWRQIITTNYDLLVERAYDDLASKSQKIYDLKPIRNTKAYNYRESNSEIKYVKLNGCISDIGAYPLAFSSDDFERLKSFYKIVLNDLKNLSNNIQFLSAGYSYSDDFGKELLTRFDSYNFRDRKWIINIDPFVNDEYLPYLTNQKICVIKCSFEDFFLAYNEWEGKNLEVAARKNSMYVTNNRGSQINIPAKLLVNINGVLKQLNLDTKDAFVKDIEFYKGEEPTFNLITRNIDVIKTNRLAQLEKEIVKVVEQNDKTFLPIFFIKGEFGIGKSTFALRLIYELEKNSELDLIAFEITDFTRLRKEYLIELILASNSKHFLLFCDEIEVESTFKSLMEIQRDLSIEQFNDVNIFFIVPVRENILERHKLNRHVSNAFEFEFDGKYEDTEIDDLLEKLKLAGLISYRDINERNSIKTRIKNDYDNDSFVSLLGVITNGRHENDLINAFQQLTAVAQDAFLYTALLHKHKLLMPASWLKQNIKMNWDDFTAKVIKAEGKGLLIQEVIRTNGTHPDLYFRTKHPLIAEKVVNRFYPNKDKQYKFYDDMLRAIEAGQSSSYLAINLLKSFGKNEEYSNDQVNLLYNSAYTRLSEEPFFLLNYAINLQHRRTESDLKKALDLLIYAESLLERRNDKFIHRRGVINFELAKIYYAKEDEPNFALIYLNEARELFVVKQVLDPFSSYSYSDYIKLLLWELENIDVDKDDDLQKLILIEELLDLGDRAITDDPDKIHKLRSQYSSFLSDFTDNVDYLEYLQGLYEDRHFRPYSCILLYNYYSRLENEAKCNHYLEEMQNYKENFEVLKFLFVQFGRRLYDPNIRAKFLSLSKSNPRLEKDNHLRYNYFNFIAETYNYHIQEGKSYLQNIQSKYAELNPEFRQVWRDSDGNVTEFDGTIIKRDDERHKAIKISSKQITVRLKKGNYDKFKVGQEVKVRLNFYLYGLMAEIIGD